MSDAKQPPEQDHDAETEQDDASGGAPEAPDTPESVSTAGSDE
jgi:hypothetical protein